MNIPRLPATLQTCKLQANSLYTPSSIVLLNGTAQG